MGCPGVGGFSASLSEEMSSASPNRSSATDFLSACEHRMNNLLSSDREKKKELRRVNTHQGSLTLICTNVTVRVGI